VLSKAFKLF